MSCQACRNTDRTCAISYSCRSRSSLGIKLMLNTSTWLWQLSSGCTMTLYTNTWCLDKCTSLMYPRLGCGNVSSYGCGAGSGGSAPFSSTRFPRNDDILISLTKCRLTRQPIHSSFAHRLLRCSWYATPRQIPMNWTSGYECSE
ncbi:hypothetical protein ABW21_db0200430 [Orbilia brochopaga]|nr:hypothetical protein ABW21_db0200430 [Drechslerella brochopaga]